MPNLPHLVNFFKKPLKVKKTAYLTQSLAFVLLGFLANQTAFADIFHKCVFARSRMATGGAIKLWGGVGSNGEILRHGTCGKGNAAYKFVLSGAGLSLEIHENEAFSLIAVGGSEDLTGVYYGTRITAAFGGGFMKSELYSAHSGNFLSLTGLTGWSIGFGFTAIKLTIAKTEGELADMHSKPVLQVFTVDGSVKKDPSGRVIMPRPRLSAKELYKQTAEAIEFMVPLLIQRGEDAGKVSLSDWEQAQSSYMFRLQEIVLDFIHHRMKDEGRLIPWTAHVLSEFTKNISSTLLNYEGPFSHLAPALDVYLYHSLRLQNAFPDARAELPLSFSGLESLDPLRRQVLDEENPSSSPLLGIMQNIVKEDPFGRDLEKSGVDLNKLVGYLVHEGFKNRSTRELLYEVVYALRTPDLTSDQLSKLHPSHAKSLVLSVSPVLFNKKND